MTAYLTNLLIIISIWAILGASLNLVMGYTGLLNLGHIAFFAIGAYTSALLVFSGWPFLLALIFGGLVSAVFGFALIYAVRNLKGDYLALATLGFTFVSFSVLLNWTSLTRGPLGLPGIPKPEIFGFLIRSNLHYLVFVLLILAVSYLIIYRLTHSRYGKLLEAVRDDEVGLLVLGKNVSKLKFQSMAIAAFFAGIAGSLFAHYISYIDPTSFYVNQLILVLTIVIVGGLASLRGSLLAAVVVLTIPEALRFVSIPSSILGPSRQIIFALFLLGILLLRPKGFLGRVDLK